MRRFFRWLWYARFEHLPDPMLVDLPAGQLRFVFVNVKVAPQVMVWCQDGTVISHGPADSNEVMLNLPSPARAMGISGARRGALLTQVYASDGCALILGAGVLAKAFSLDHVTISYLPRWRVIWNKLADFWTRPGYDY